MSFLCRPKKTLFFLLVLFGFFFASEVQAATWYVDTATGNNTNAGTGWDAPVAQMVRAQALAANGDTIMVKSGTYVEPTTAGGSTGNIFFSKAIAWIADDGSGGAGSVIVRAASTANSTVAAFIGTAVQSWTGFTFDGQGTIPFVMLGQTAPQSNKTWTNVTFKDGTAAGQLLRFYSTPGGTNNVCNNCVFTGTGATGVRSDATPVVLNNPTFSMTTSGAVGVSLSTNLINGSIITGGTATLTGT